MMITNKIINNKQKANNKQTAEVCLCSDTPGGGGEGTPNIYINIPLPIRLLFSGKLPLLSLMAQLSSSSAVSLSISIKNYIYKVCQNAGLYLKNIKLILSTLDIGLKMGVV